MPLPPGARLGSYEILAAIGAGGMGEVYRARDTALGREVALKLLLERVSADPERLARFEREARVLASLSHANIATLFGFERDRDTRFLVMELVRGETLADRIARGPIPLEQAIPIFLAIAAGLEAAHENGVIHRDLKPANIKVSDHGEVKILDFGLAKALAPEPGDKGDPALSHSPTITLDATQRGEILGTAAYMSPEQARGRAVDERADIWSFGVCLWEALTGRRLFAGTDVADTLAAVLRADPEWRELPAAVPAPVRRALRRCLARDPHDRLRAIGDVALELEEARDGTDAAGEPAPAAAAPGSALRRCLPWALALAATAVAAWALWSRADRDRGQPGPAPTHFQVDLPADTDFAPATTNNMVALSPDGSTLAWSGRRGERLALYRRRMGSLAIEEVRGTEDGIRPFFSPDGRWLAFQVRDELRKVPEEGGTATKIAERGRGLGGATWSEDGYLYLWAGAGETTGMTRMPAAGGETEVLLRTQDAQQRAPGFRYLDFRSAPVPGSSWQIFAGAANDGRDLLVAYDRASGETRVIGEGAGPRLLPTGHLLFGRRNAVLAAALDADAMQLRGEPLVVLEGVDVDWQGYPLLAVARNGTLAYVPAGAVAGGQLVLTDRSGTVLEELVDVPDYSLGARLSPRGDRATIALSARESGGLELWSIGVDHGGRVPLTSVADRAGWTGVWSPDGRQLAFVSYAETVDVAIAAADGTGAIRGLIEDAKLAPRVDLHLGDWSADGRYLALVLQSPRGDWDIWTYDLEAGEMEELLVTRFDEAGASFSPDTRWVAYTSDRSGLFQVFVRAFPGGGEEAQISTRGGRYPHWTHDGRTVYFLDGNAVMTAEVFDAQGALAPSEPRVLFRGPFRSALDFDVSADGERFLLIRYGEEERPRIHVIENWLAELERRVPIS